ncbi:MAG: hypothetical protein AB7V46_15865 [Thermomicrobiales bacterium]
MPVRKIPFVPRERYEWIEAPEGCNFAGFAIEVRVNLTNAELREYREALAEVARDRMGAAEAANARLAELRESDSSSPSLEERQERRELTKAIEMELTDRIDRLDRFRWELTAPYVRAWNVYLAGTTEEPEPAPPPCVAGASTFDVITPAMAQWVIRTVETAYATGKGLTKSSAPPGDSHGPTPTASDGETEGPREVPD